MERRCDPDLRRVHRVGPQNLGGAETSFSKNIGGIPPKRSNQNRVRTYHCRTRYQMYNTRPSFLESESSSDRKLWGTGTEGHAAVAKLLLDRGADAAQPTNDGSTPLLSAISRGHADIVALLLKFGADVSHPTKDGRIPLVSACLHGRLPVVALLLEHGADASLPNRDRLGLRTRRGPSCFQTRIAHGDTDPRFPKH